MQGKAILDFRDIAKAVANTRPIKKFLTIFLPAHVGLRFRSARLQIRLGLFIWTLHLGIDTARAPKEMWVFAPLAFLEIRRCDVFPTPLIVCSEVRLTPVFGKDNGAVLLSSNVDECPYDVQRTTFFVILPRSEKVI